MMIKASFTLFRDFTPSPYDEFDSHHSHSNSPDLKTSENEFIQTLEGRIEELITAKKKESDKITQLQEQLRILIQVSFGIFQQIHLPFPAFRLHFALLL